MAVTERSAAAGSSSVTTSARARSMPATFSTSGRQASPKNTGRPLLRASMTRLGLMSNAMYRIKRSSSISQMDWPTRPYPATTTKSTASAVSASICRAPISPRRRSSREEIDCPSDARAGVQAMDRATTNSRRLQSRSGKTPTRWARPKTTKANSPPWERINPVRRALAKLMPKSLPQVAMTPVLSASRPATIDVTTPALARARLKSMLKPTVMKKRPSRSPRNGLMSASTWWENLVSASIIPARKGPRVSDKPRPSVRALVARMVNKMVATKASCDSALAANLKSGFKSVAPAVTNKPKATTALAAEMPMALAMALLPPPPAKSGVTTSKGTTARS
mmetsp:Transcript_55665/g.136635  ORF Transcript_55665/g.136635 Transcript_55665/m.136635 type:complete len:337 (+) Transcript_55665:433-1443(+)